MDKPREFKISEQAFNNSIEKIGEHSGSDAFELHVIEYSAYEQLKKENEEEKQNATKRIDILTNKLAEMIVYSEAKVTKIEQLKSKLKELHHYLISILPQLRTHGALGIREEIIEKLKSSCLKEIGDMK